MTRKAGRRRRGGGGRGRGRASSAPAWLTMGPTMPSRSISACACGGGESEPSANELLALRAEDEQAERTLVSVMSSGKRDSGTQTSVTQHLEPLTYSRADHSAICEREKAKSAGLRRRSAEWLLLDVGTTASLLLPHRRSNRTFLSEREEERGGAPCESAKSPRPPCRSSQTRTRSLRCSA